MLGGHDHQHRASLFRASPDTGQRRGQAARADRQRALAQQADGLRQPLQLGLVGCVDHDDPAGALDAGRQLIGRGQAVLADMGASEQAGDMAFGDRRDRVGRGRGLGDRFAVHQQHAAGHGPAGGGKSRADDRDRVRRPGGAGRFDFGQERPRSVESTFVQALDAGLSQALDVGAHDPGGLIGGQGATVRRDRQHLGLPVAGQRLVGAADGQVRAPAGAHELHRGVARTGQVVRHDGDHGIHSAPRAALSGAAGATPSSPSTATGFSSPARFRKYDASTGARIELISTQAATWAVAVPTYCWNEGSAAATTAGVAMALPAVVPAAKPRPLLRRGAGCSGSPGRPGRP